MKSVHIIGVPLDLGGGRRGVGIPDCVADARKTAARAAAWIAKL